MPTEEPLIVGCTLKELPAELLLLAASTAIEINPANAPNIQDSVVAARGLKLTPNHLAVVTHKRWKVPVRLGVKFLDSPSQEFKNKLLAHANLWNKTADVQFSESTSNDGVRLSRESGGYWSFMGTDIRHIPVNQPTMNLEGFTVNTRESEWPRVVCHEFGHTLGMPHEHTLPELQERLHREKVIREYARTQGWTRRDVISQIFPPPEDVIASEHADPESVMAYSFGGHLTKDGQPILGGSRINERDYAFVATIYPKKEAPPIQPPPPAGVIHVKEEKKMWLNGKETQPVQVEYDLRSPE